MDKQIWTAEQTRPAREDSAFRRIRTWLFSRHTATGLGATVFCMGYVLEFVAAVYDGTPGLARIINDEGFWGGLLQGCAYATIAVVMIAIAITYRQMSLAFGSVSALVMAAGAIIAQWLFISISSPSPAVLFIFWIISYGFYRLMPRVDDVAKPKAHSLEVGIAGLISGLRARAARQRQQATAVLCAIIAATGFGIWIFVRAESFSQLTAVETEIGRLTPMLEEELGVRKALNDGLEMLLKTKDDKNAPESETRVLLKGIEAQQSDLLRISRYREATGAEDTGLKLLEALKGVSDSAAFQAGTRFETFLVSTISTRIGIVLLLVFLIQILVSLYRYGTRLAGAYDMQADALSMKGEMRELELDKLATFFANQLVDFGNVPKAPSESLQQVLKDTLAAIRREEAKRG